MSGEPGSGKSTVARSLFPHLPIVDDGLLWGEARGMDDKYPRMAIISRNLAKVCGNIDDFMSKYFDDAVWNEYFDMIVSKGDGRTFVFEGYIPPQMREPFKRRLEGDGYMVLEVVLPELACSYNELIRLAKVEARKYGMFLAAASSRRP